ncbi:hypothetical protein GGH12_003253 [Coemansia sp. RSA 1822]|nr:hypothetical protein LPJ76_005209 [Coemansia sp. RSA 638]KAJ2545108.1 hypothetical protein GGF49_000717 [Coemansia sp. RSA 1853]KAJ2562402.1 hypothetical protein GGH12_003253 [Coemansia sp. RSA 1822]
MRTGVHSRVVQIAPMLVQRQITPHTPLHVACFGQTRLYSKTSKRPSAFETTVQALQDTSRNSEQTSNRQLFAQLQPDRRTLEKLDMLQIGTVKHGRFERKRWFQYNEPHVKLPHIAFFAGAQTPASFPVESLPEVGVVGRSNVGKSTLINQLCGSLTARVSDKPGLTQQINFYTAGRDLHLVDMPGYGFAFAKEEAAKSWLDLIETYVRKRKTLRRVMLLLDARHGIKANDREFMELLDRSNTQFQIVLTKCDLVHRIDLAKRHKLVSMQTEKSRNCIPRVLMVSARERSGLNELRKDILHTCTLGQKYLANHKKLETIALAEYLEQLKIYQDTARAKKRRQ